VHAYQEERLVIEGAAAVGIAALLDGRIERVALKSGPVVLVVSGANIDIGLHRRLIQEA
jgi:threonine dehydratase